MPSDSVCFLNLKRFACYMVCKAIAGDRWQYCGQWLMVDCLTLICAGNNGGDLVGLQCLSIAGYSIVLTRG